jgi:hypothetical protein
MLRATFFLLGLLAATTGPTPAQAPPPEAPTLPATPRLREISPGIFEYNGVRLDKKSRRISFPATVNQREGLIEYLLVNEKGKIHESLFSTAIPPLDIHVAMLLVGLKEDEHANANEPVPPSAIDTPYLQSAPKLKGTDVQISVAWMQDGRRREVSPDEWILNLQTNQPMTPGPWTYNGSLVQNGVFLANEELSIVAVITDPTALVNNPRAGYDNDEIWQVQDKAVPPLNTPVDISITLADSPKTKP